LVRHIVNDRRQQAIQLWDSMNAIERMMVNPIVANAVQSYRAGLVAQPTG
jgi:hypothetical protein